MKRMQVPRILSACMSMLIGSMISASGVSTTLDALTMQLQNQLRRAGDSIHNCYAKVQGRCMAKIDSFKDAIPKEDLTEKFDTKLSATQDDMHRQFDRFRVQLGSIVPNAKDRARVEKKLEVLQQKVDAKLASFSGTVKNQASKALQNISKKAERLSDQVASVLDSAKGRDAAEQVAVSTEESEQALPVCGIANNDEVPPAQEGSAS